MAYTYKGTKVTGTGEAGFLTVGVKKNDTYLNTQTGHVYVCTEAYSNWAKWKYVRTDIIAKPNQGVSGFSAPTLSDRCLTASWSIPDWVKNEQNGKRATTQQRIWQVNTRFVGGKSEALKVAGDIGFGTQSLLYLTWFRTGDGTLYQRSSFYPLTNRTISTVSCTVYTKNSKGLGPKVMTYREFKTPRPPVISEPSFNAENGHLSFTITTDAGTDFYERYDTRYKVTVLNSRISNTEVVVTDASSTNTEITTSYDAADYMQMGYDDYIKVTVEAWARGFRGDSGHATRTYYIAYPKQPSISEIDISSEDTVGKCTVFVDTNNDEKHPVDNVKLEYLANSDYSSASQIPGDASWSDTGIIDDADCTALSVAVTELIPEKSKYTWLRVKSWHAAEGRLFRYSTYQLAMHEPAPTAEDDNIVIVSVEPRQDSIKVLLAWDADGTDDATGTELSWSDELDTWKSTKEPERYSFTWFDAVDITHKGTTYHKKADITIKGLKEGEQYYIMARRYYEGDTASYSEYSDYASCITNAMPDSVVLVCDKYVAKGSSLPVYWTFSGNGIQTAWQIETQETDGAINAYPRSNATSLSSSWLSLTNGGSALTPQTGKKYSLMKDSGGYSASTQFKWNGSAYVVCSNIILAQGSGSTGFAQIPADRLQKNATNDSLKIRVGASTGSDFVWSEWNTVAIMSAPTLSINVGSTLTSQPFSFTATSSKVCRLLVIVSSEGASGQFPNGRLTQTAGDTIHSDIYNPTWTTSQGSLTATITVPTKLDFWNYGNYRVSVTAIDDLTGLSSDTKESTFSVNWSNTAANPTCSYAKTTDVTVDITKTYYTRTGAGTDADPYVYEIVSEPEVSGLSNYYERIDYVKLTPIDETDDTGRHRKAIQIELDAADIAGANDVFDVYRLNGDGAQLIGEGLPLTHTTADEYAPYGDDLTLYYRAVIRTPDGDVNFADFEYNAEGNYLRFDWDSYSLELPYNLSIADSYKKGVDIRQHMDGSSDGYWNQNIERNGSLSTDVIRLVQDTEIDLARQLARYPGAVFVRTPDGCAYEADVQISDMSATHKNIMSIAIDATEVGLTQEFMLPVPEAEEEEEE